MVIIMKKYDKPFCPFEELIDLLQSKHGLTIGDRKLARSILQAIPYYDLVNGYKDILMTNDRYHSGIGLTDVFLMHAFDRDFQNALFEFSLCVEDYFKNILSYVIADSFGVDESVYLAYKNYLVKKATHSKFEIRRDKILPIFRNIAMKSPDNPTRYYQLHHNHIPPWILMKNVTFSLSTNLLVLLKRPQKKQILDYMIPSECPWDQRFPVLLYTLTVTRKCRNTIAHNLKFTSFSAKRYMNNLDKSVLRQFISPTLLHDDELNEMKYLDGIYGYIVLSLSIIPERVSKFLIVNRLFNLIDTHPFMTGNFQQIGNEIKEMYFNGINVPLDFRERLTAYIKDLFLDN